MAIAISIDSPLVIDNLFDKRSMKSFPLNDFLFISKKGPILLMIFEISNPSISRYLNIVDTPDISYAFWDCILYMKRKKDEIEIKKK